MVIEFGILSYKLLIPLLYPIFNQIRKAGMYYDSPFLYITLSTSISYLLAGLVYLLILYRSRNLKKLPIIIENSIDRPSAVYQVYLENENNRKKSKIKKFISLIFLSFLNMIPTALGVFFLKQKKLENEVLSINLLSTIFFYVFFSKIILSSKMFRHQLISILTISFCSLIFLSLDIIKISHKEINFAVVGKSALYYISLYGLHSLFDVLVKRHFKIHLNDPYLLMFFVGLFCLILMIPLDLFVHFYKEVGSELIDQVKELYHKRKLFFLWFI